MTREKQFVPNLLMHFKTDLINTSPVIVVYEFAINHINYCEVELTHIT